MIKLDFTDKDNRNIIISSAVLDKYRNTCDSYIVNIKRELSRILTDYMRFAELLEINDFIHDIFYKLLNNEYDNIHFLITDKSQLIKLLQTFTKKCNDTIDTDIAELVNKQCKNISLTISKLMKIIIDANT